MNYEFHVGDYVETKCGHIGYVSKINQLSNGHNMLYICYTDGKTFPCDVVDHDVEHSFIHNYKDIYHLSDHRSELIRLDGYGAKSIDNLLESIEKSRNVKLENFITALGIPNIGLSAAKAISKKFNGDHYEFIQALSSDYDFSQIDDFGEITNKSLHDWWKSKDPMAELLPIEMNFIVEEKSADNSLSGLKFCITGTFSQSRDELKAILESKGAKFISSVSKNLDVLFIGDKAGSKLAKAQQLGIKIADENELMKILGD